MGCRCGTSARPASIATPPASGSPGTWTGSTRPASRCASARIRLEHEKLVLLYGQGITIFGSSNWTSPSANYQQEHNYFTTKSWIFQWFVDEFERKLPRMDGHEVARRIRAEATGHDMLLIALTGYGQTDDQERSHAAGFDYHLVKPIDDELLRRVLGQPRHAPQSASRASRVSGSDRDQIRV